MFKSVVKLGRSPIFYLNSKRLIHIKTLTTPNENALKFLSTDGEMLQTRGSKSIVIKNTDENLINHSKLAQQIF